MPEFLINYVFSLDSNVSRNSWLSVNVIYCNFWYLFAAKLEIKISLK